MDLVTKAEDELTDKEIFSYILLPGFSTNETCNGILRSWGGYGCS